MYRLSHAALMMTMMLVSVSISSQVLNDVAVVERSLQNHHFYFEKSELWNGIDRRLASRDSTIVELIGDTSLERGTVFSIASADNFEHNLTVMTAMGVLLAAALKDSKEYSTSWLVNYFIEVANRAETSSTSMAETMKIIDGAEIGLTVDANEGIIALTVEPRL